VNAGQSPLEWAAGERARARRGARRRVLAWLGLNKEARRADALTARTQVGAEGERRTAALLKGIPAGWTVLHGQKLPGRRHDLDHVLGSPCGTAVVVLDSKRWNASASWPTRLQGGRVYCGGEDRHGQIEAVAGYAARLQEVLGMPGVTVWPLLVVHGSRIEGGRLEARALRWPGVVHVLGPEWLVPTLAAAPRRGDPVRAGVLVARLRQVLTD